jgi:hypothetical protein
MNNASKEANGFQPLVQFTDGFISDDEVSAVDYIYLHQGVLLKDLSEEFQSKIIGIVPSDSQQKD